MTLAGRAANIKLMNGAKACSSFHKCQSDKTKAFFKFERRAGAAWRQLHDTHIKLSMVAIVNRRALIGSILSSTLCSSSVLIEDVAKFIVNSTPRSFREAVQHSNSFLYRGQEQVASNSPPMMAGHVCTPPPDLLLEGTYNDKEALEYFKCLEDYLSSLEIMAKPSTGHVGTSVKEDAKEWGEVVSVWPLGTDLSYVFPKSEQVFFPSTTTCRDGKFIIDAGLETALRDGREVLFASWYGGTAASTTPPSSSFLAVPEMYDKKLRNLLLGMNYGLN